MKNNFMILVVALASPTFYPIRALAVGDFSGHWVATSGTVSGIMQSSCTKVEIVITQDEKGLTTQKYSANCGLFSTDWGPVTENIKGNDVYENGDQVGTIDETTLLTNAPDGGVVYAYNLKLLSGPNGEPQLQSYYGAQNGVGAMVVEAILTKVSR